MISKKLQHLELNSERDSLQNLINFAFESVATFSIKEIKDKKLFLYGGIYLSNDGITKLDFSDTIEVDLIDNNINYVYYSIATNEVKNSIFEVEKGNFDLYEIELKNGFATLNSKSKKITSFHIKNQELSNVYNLPNASQTTLGGVKVDGYTFTVNSNGELQANNSSSGISLIIVKDNNVINNQANIFDFKDYSDSNLNSIQNTIELSNLTNYENIFAFLEIGNKAQTTITGLSNDKFGIFNSTSNIYINSANEMSSLNLLRATTKRELNLATTSNKVTQSLSLLKSDNAINLFKTTFGSSLKGYNCPNFFAGIYNIQYNINSQDAFTGDYNTINSNGIVGVGYKSSDNNFKIIYSDENNITTFVDLPNFTKMSNVNEVFYELQILFYRNKKLAHISLKNLLTNEIFETQVLFYDLASRGFMHQTLQTNSLDSTTVGFSYSSFKVYQKLGI